MGMDVFMINEFLQKELSRKGLDEVGAVEAAEWLNEAGLSRNSTNRPGLPLRNLLRKKMIVGQKQELNRRWYIYRTDWIIE